MSISIEARRESIAYLHSEEELTLGAGQLAIAASADIVVEDYLDALKPLHYAALAKVINHLVEEISVVGLVDVHSRYSNEFDDPFNKLRSDAFGVFRRCHRAIATTPAYEQAGEYPRVIGKLDSNRFIDLGSQLLAGWSTATSFMLTTLANFPAIIDTFSQEATYSKTELVQIARRSVGLSWQMAMLCVNQLMAAREVLGDELPHTPWSVEQTVFEVSHLEATYKEGRVFSVKFKDLENMEIPAGFSPHESVPEITERTLLKDIPCNQARTIGCPITLLPGQLNKLWNWFIDALDQRDAWETVKQ
jgi:hypothetical protein